MKITTTRAHYTSVQIVLHWAVAVLVLAAFLSGDGLGRVARAHVASGAGYFEDAPLHVWFGTLALGLILLRIPIRLVLGAPPLERAPYPWVDTAAVWGHRALYALMVIAPALGVVAWTVDIWWLGELHALTSNWLMILAAGHAVAALVHHYLWHDGTLRRMLPVVKPPQG